MNDGHKPKPQSPYATPPESPCSTADSTPNSTTSSPLYEPAEEHEERVFTPPLPPAVMMPPGVPGHVWLGPVARLPGSEGTVAYDNDPPYAAAMIYGTWNAVYAWPARPGAPPSPPLVTFAPASKLESVLFSCRCHSENVDKFAPVKVLNEHIPGRVIACQVVNKEADVQPALDDVHCRCRASPLVSKFVILPINEEYLIYYAKIAKEVYTKAQPNTAYLLYRDIPTSLEVDHQLAGLDIFSRAGAPTFMIKYKEDAE
ncbi:unnamed protein product [Plutella xylostella]|uniref:(diamondback moth) hypothetical protein n=1 Tax=Plutella xylostella TaxID=51655 RepID=A0A8S4F7D1_PLUXY|nr:unnamed protein product [Plutella xylostella]